MHKKTKFDLSSIENHILKSSDAKWAFGKEISDYGLKADKSVISFNKMLSRHEHIGVGDGGRIKTLNSVSLIFLSDFNQFSLTLGLSYFSQKYQRELIGIREQKKSSR
jgi:hypothetical protein